MQEDEKANFASSSVQCRMRWANLERFEVDWMMF